MLFRSTLILLFHQRLDLQLDPLLVLSKMLQVYVFLISSMFVTCGSPHGN